MNKFSKMETNNSSTNLPNNYLQNRHRVQNHRLSVINSQVQLTIDDEVNGLGATAQEPSSKVKV